MKNKIIKRLLAVALSVSMPLCSYSSVLADGEEAEISGEITDSVDSSVLEEDAEGIVEDITEDVVEDIVEGIADFTDDSSSSEEYENTAIANEYEVLRDENGNVYDLGGVEIIIRDWWSAGDEDNTDYIDWCEETYNFTIKSLKISDWGSTPADFIDYTVTGGDDKYYAFVLRDDPAIASAMQAGLMYDLSTLDCFDFNEYKFMANGYHNMYRYNGGIYAMAVGTSEPANGMFMNKTLLRQAGINPDDIYEMQKNGTWTWDAFESILKQLEGKIDGVSGFVGNNSVILNDFVWSNNGRYFSSNDDGFTCEVDSSETVEGLKEALYLMEKYEYPGNESDDWDAFIQYYLDGCAYFLIENGYPDSYGGYLEDIDYELGYVVVPKGPKASNYDEITYCNPIVIPGCYDAEKAWKIAFAWNLYTDEINDQKDKYQLPGPYENFADEKARTETLPLLARNGSPDYSRVVPGINLGPDFLWDVRLGCDIDRLIQEASSKWKNVLGAESSVFILQPISANVTVSKSARFNVGLRGAGNYSYQWQYSLDYGDSWNNLTVEGAKTNSVIIDYSFAEQYGEFSVRCVVTDEEGTEHISDMVWCTLAEEMDFPNPEDVDVSKPLIYDENGDVVDLGGMEIIVRDWWSSSDMEPANDYEKTREKYLEWAQETYNFKIKQVAMGDWRSAPDDFKTYVDNNGDSNNYVFMLRQDTLISQCMNEGYMYDLATIDCLDFNDSKFGYSNIHKVYSLGDSIYGMYAGQTEVRIGVFFNKLLLRNAGINPDSIYEMQANGTWTWEAWTDIMDRVQRDVDGDGEIDVYGTCQNSQNVIRASVFANGGQFIGKDADGFSNGLRDPKTLAGLEFGTRVLNDYSRNIAGEDWDIYKEDFINGRAAFMVEESYVAEPNGFACDMYDLGFVAFPKGPNCSTYTNIAQENICVIPSCYDEDRAWKIAFAWNLYTDSVPAYEEYPAYEWKVTHPVLDSRASSETMPLMLNNCVADMSVILGDINLGPDLLWAYYNGLTDYMGPVLNIRNYWDTVIDAANEDWMVRKETVDPGFKVAGFAGNIGSNFSLKYYIEYRADVELSSNLWAEFDVNGVKQRADYTLIESVDSKKYCVFNCSMGAAQMNDGIEAVIHYNGKTYNIDGTYSVAGYLNTILSNKDNRTDYAAAAPMIKALMNYGANAQVYFDYKTDNLINANIDNKDSVSSLAADTVKSKIIAQVGGNLGDGELSFVGASLVCKLDTELKLYYYSNSGLTEEQLKSRYSVSVNGCENELTVDYNNGIIVVTIKEITVGQLGNSFEVVLANGAAKVSTVYSPMIYIKKAMDSENEKLVNLCKSLYLYYYSAPM